MAILIAWLGLIWKHTVSVWMRVCWLNSCSCNNHWHWRPAKWLWLCPSRHQMSMQRQVDVGHDVRQTLHFGWKWKSGWRQYLTSIWRWLNIGFWLHNLKTTKSQRQLTSVLDINLTLTLDVGFTLDFGHPTSQPKFNQISTSYDVVCLFCACWGHSFFSQILSPARAFELFHKSQKTKVGWRCCRTKGWIHIILNKSFSHYLNHSKCTKVY